MVYYETPTDWSIMYASAMRKAVDVMTDDHIKIGENGRLYRVNRHFIEKFDGRVVLELYYVGDESKTTVAILSVNPTENLKVYNQ